MKNNEKKMIKVWRFEDAPENYKNLSENGGDEDWLAFVPKALENEYISLFDEGTSFGVCCVNEYKVKDGVVYIGAHAK
jgi:hypothetical protein